MATTTRTRVVHVEPVWDTAISMHFITDDEVSTRAFIQELNRFFHRVGEVLSAFDPWSDIARWRRGDVAVTDCDPMLADVLDAASDAYLATHGHFDPWWRGGAADPTGLVKGWAVDRAAAMAHRRGAHNFMLNAGGDVRTSGERLEGGPWRVGIECPWQTDLLLDVLEGDDLCVATSGLHRRGAHITRDGKPVTDLLALTVVGPNLTQADAFSTAAFACGRGASAFLRSLDPEWSFMIVGRDQHVCVSSNWPGSQIGC